MFAGKPVIGVVGGIGSGKSFIAKLFGELGALSISADQQVRAAYDDSQVKIILRRWWGDEVFQHDGSVDRQAVADKVFGDPGARKWLENLLHPMVHKARETLMEEHADDAQVLAYVWDTPLLLEAGLKNQCDAVVFVDADREARVTRVDESRGWTPMELDRREKLQMPLDKKRALSDYVIRNTADAEYARGQVRDVFSRILAGSSKPNTC